jgi:hypothetical protein
MASAESLQGPALKALAEKCPLFPHATTTGHNQSLRGRESTAFCAGAISNAVLPVHLDISYRALSSRSHQRRGPPRLT